MISLVVVGIAMVGVFITGQSTPTEIPSLSMIPGTTDEDLLLYHNGGDSLDSSQFFVRVDGIDYRPDQITLLNQGGEEENGGEWDSWDVGETLVIDGKSDYNQILIMSTKGGQQSIITGIGGAAEVEPVLVADFYASPISGDVPLKVYFFDQSIGDIESWSWDFGDGTSSGSINPEHIYNVEGTYTVSLTVSNSEGSNTKTENNYIHVIEVPPSPLNADFTAVPTAGPAPLLVNFADVSSGNPTSWLWTFGDGQTSTNQSPVHVYTSAGFYNVSLTVWNASNGNDTEIKTDYINVGGLPQPAGWWTFDESSGNVAEDSSGNNNDGIINGSYTRGTGACGNSLYFDGVTTYISVPAGSTLDADSQVTLCAWIYPEYPINKSGIPDDYRNYVSIIDKGENDEDNYEFFVQKTDSVSRLTFESDTTYDFNGLPYEYGRWQHLACVIDSGTSTGTVYIDGTNVGTFTVSSSLTTNDQPVYIGMQKIGGSYPDWATFNFKGWLDDVRLYTTALTGDQISEIYGTCTPPVNPPVADFSADPTSGYLPLEVTFSDLSTGNPTSWLWEFGDGENSTAQNPVHNYTSSGSYNVTLTSCNNDGCDSITKTGYIGVFGFADYVVNESVFVYGNQVSFAGTDVTGTGSTVIITGDLDTSDLNGGALVAVSDIYIDGNAYLDGGSASFGSASDPGNIYINGDLSLWSGGRNVYGDVYVNGDFRLKDAKIHGNVYVDGDLTLGWTPTLDAGSYIYYTGSISHPSNYHQSILDKCIQVATVPEVVMPDIAIPSAKDSQWYDSRGYVSSGTLTDNLKIFASSYSSTNWLPSAENVIIVAETGDITITGLGGSGITGVLFAPNGKVTFNGGFFEGVVIAKDGFYVTSGGTDVEFKNMDYYITDPNDYPF